MAVRRESSYLPAMVKHRHSPGPALTLGIMRQLGVRGLIVSCLDQECRHEVILGVDDYADGVEVPAFAPRMACSKCGGKRIDVRPNWKEMPIAPPKLLG